MPTPLPSVVIHLLSSPRMSLVRMSMEVLAVMVWIQTGMASATIPQHEEAPAPLLWAYTPATVPQCWWVCICVCQHGLWHPWVRDISLLLANPASDTRPCTQHVLRSHLSHEWRMHGGTLPKAAATNLPTYRKGFQKNCILPKWGNWGQIQQKEYAGVMARTRRF